MISQAASIPLSACRFQYQLIRSMSEVSVSTWHCTFSNLYFPSLPGVSKSTSKSIFLTDREGKRLSVTTSCNLHFLDWHLWPCQCLSSYVTVTNLNFVTSLCELSCVDQAQLWFLLDHLVSLIPVPSFLWPLSSGTEMTDEHLSHRYCAKSNTKEAVHRPTSIRGLPCTVNDSQCEAPSQSCLARWRALFFHLATSLLVCAKYTWSK